MVRILESGVWRLEVKERKVVAMSTDSEAITMEVLLNLEKIEIEKGVFEGFRF